MFSIERSVKGIEEILAKVTEEPIYLEKLQMNHAFDCILFRIYGDFEGALESQFGISDLIKLPPVSMSTTDPLFLVLSLFGLNSDAPEVIPGFIDYTSSDYNDEYFIPNANLIVGLLKGLK